MKKIIGLLLVSTFIFAQSLPYDFEMESSKRSKVSAVTPASNTIEDILIDENGTIWLGTSRGLSKSTDNGENWTNYYQTETFGVEKVSKVGYHNGAIWAGTWHFTEVFDQSQVEGSGLRYSTDQGNTWIKIDQPVDNPNDTTITYGNNILGNLPVTVEINNMPYDIDFTSDAIWIATFAGGLRKSTDMGNTWQKVVLPPDYLDEIHPDDTLNFDLSPSAGNLGFEENLNHRVFSIKVVNDNLIYVGTAGGINKSTDGGVSWKKFTHQNQTESISGNFIVELDYDEYTNTVWAATWKAVDLAEFWGISASSDAGETWQTYLPDSRTHDFGFKYRFSGSTITYSEPMAATESGVFRTSNSGSTWIANPNPIDSESGVSLQSGSFRSVASNYNSDFSTDIWLGSLGGLAKINESGAAFWDGEWTVYRAANREEDIETYPYPNPFSPDEESITIRFYNQKEIIETTIRLFDFGMNLVRTVIQNTELNGEESPINNRTRYEFEQSWDGRDENGSIVPNGVYFYRIDVGSDEPVFGKIMVLM